MTVLETPRLLLRPLTTADTEALVAYRGDPEVVRHLPFPPMDTAEITRRLREQWHRLTLDEDGQTVTLGIEERETGRLVGDVNLTLTSREHGVGDVGWTLHPGARGRGYATEAATGILDWGFGPVGLRRITAKVFEGNDASAALCRRLGMRAEGRTVESNVFMGRLTTVLHFAVLSREWAARRSDGAAR